MKCHNGKVEDFAKGQEMSDARQSRDKVNLTGIPLCDGRKRH